MAILVTNSKLHYYRGESSEPGYSGEVLIRQKEASSKVPWGGENIGGGRPFSTKRKNTFKSKGTPLRAVGFALS